MKKKLIPLVAITLLAACTQWAIQSSALGERRNAKWFMESVGSKKQRE